METTAVDQAEKIRLGFGVGPESGRGGVLGTTRLPTLSGGGAEMQRGLRFNLSGLDRYESQSLRSVEPHGPPCSGEGGGGVEISCLKYMIDKGRGTDCRTFNLGYSRMTLGELDNTNDFRKVLLYIW